MKKIAIIGGGASGMMAGIVASHHGAQVTIFEHRDRVGRKLLTTGNGKCNLTNLSLSKDDYRGNHPSFVMPVFEKFSVEDTLHFFEKFGFLPLFQHRFAPLLCVNDLQRRRFFLNLPRAADYIFATQGRFIQVRKNFSQKHKKITRQSISDNNIFAHIHGKFTFL